MAQARSDFENEADKDRPSFVGEMVHFLANNKKWWLLPILVCLAVLALLAFFMGSGAAPFIYTIF
jgi:hypothetical protein